MNFMNLLAYLIYVLITFFITVKVGWICYLNGIHFIEDELKDPTLSANVNKVLLTGYYLMNLGYACLMLYTWHHVNSLPELITQISSRSAYIVISLGIMHYFNITAIYILRQKNNSIIHHP